MAVIDRKTGFYQQSPSIPQSRALVVIDRQMPQEQLSPQVQPKAEFNAQYIVWLALFIKNVTPRELAILTAVFGAIGYGFVSTLFFPSEQISRVEDSIDWVLNHQMWLVIATLGIIFSLSEVARKVAPGAFELPAEEVEHRARKLTTAKNRGEADQESSDKLKQLMAGLLVLLAFYLGLQLIPVQNEAKMPVTLEDVRYVKDNSGVGNPDSYTFDYFPPAQTTYFRITGQSSWQEVAQLWDMSEWRLRQLNPDVNFEQSPQTDSLVIIQVASQ